MEDESLLKEHEISKEDWKAIKEKWVLRNENWSTDAHARAKRDELSFRGRYNKLLFLKERCQRSEEGLKEIFEQLHNVRWIEDPIKRDGYLLKEINKAKRLQQIYEGQKSKMEREKLKEFEKSDNEGFSVEIAYQCIASLELAGASIPDYETLTLGKYDALNAAIERRNKKAS